jgi:hypothetical protein
MTQTHQFAILVPLAVGAIAVMCTIFTRAIAVMTTVNFVRRQRTLGRAGAGFWIDFSIVTLTITVALVAHLIDMAYWALLFVICGQFSQLGAAYYHSAANYTTLGSGDLIMTPSWRMLGPLEAANGLLMFGVSTAIIFAVIQRLVQDRYTDLRS